jgi:fibronectin type 3 domain-containing protein
MKSSFRNRRGAQSLVTLALAILLVAAIGCGSASSSSGAGGGNPRPSAPAAPTGLTATAGDTQASLTWTASSGATSYHVKRSTTTGGPYTLVSSPTASTYTDTGLTDGTKYFYVVSAVNSVGESANSSEVNATPASLVPAAPSGLVATAGSAQVTLAWTASTGAASYHVKRSITTGGPYTQIANPTAATHIDTAVTNGTKYFYVVSAVNTSGESANSAEASATPTAVVQIPPAPTGLTATAGNAQVTLAWTASTGAASYHVKRSTTSGGPYTQIANPTAANYTDTGLTNGTPYYYVVSAVNSAGESSNSSQASATPTAATAIVTITLNPSNTKAISPYIYGLNFYSGNTGAPPLLTFDRAGGNRWTAYNWENNYSNAGSDYGPYSNDTYLSSSTTPAEAIRTLIAGDQTNKMASLVTFQLQGYVSADANGNVDVTVPLATRLAARFKQVVDKKATISNVPFTETPPTTDAYVYMDELAWTLNQKLPGIFGAAPTYPTFIELDNEPELWNSTHLEVQGPTAVTSDTYIANTITLTKALKDQFPNVLIFGPAHYGFEGIYNWQGELSATPTGANWFPDKYLPAIKTASITYGKPLVDVYDFHWYSEATDGTTRVTNLTGSTLTDAQVQAIVQSPRSLWDTSYKENSWISNDVLGGPIYILGRLQSRINAENPGMKIAITEYNNGGSQHIAGTIAQTDNLGIFGAQGVFAASLWPLSNNEPYILAAFRAYRGFDGSSACFGDTSLEATSSDVSKVAVYASEDTTTTGRYVFVAINRSATAQVTAITGLNLSGTAYLYQMTASSAATQSTIQPVFAGQQTVNGSTLTITLPALSVTTIDVH